jgi:hypothetical protein
MGVTATHCTQDSTDGRFNLFFSQEQNLNASNRCVILKLNIHILQYGK